jgi:hypothetical protein
MTRASRRKHHIIYKTTCLVTGRYYIGMHSTDDLKDRYLGSGLRLQRSVKKHGVDQHRREILEDLPTRDAASAREKELITPELRADPQCLNCGAGGLGAVDRPPTKDETRRKISEKAKAAHAAGKFVHLKGKPQDPISIAKRVAKNTGKKRTAEQVANLTAGLLRYSAEVDQTILLARGQKAAVTRLERGTNLGGRPRGIAMTEAQKAEQSARTKGKAFSEEHKAALRVPKIRASCLHCRAETTTSALVRYHTH